MYISFDYYRAFYYVAKYGSISQAAEALMNNQPNVSRTIKNLESELNCTLFVRSRKGVELTPEGEMLYAHVAAAVEHIQSGEEEICLERTLSKGVVTIGRKRNRSEVLPASGAEGFPAEVPGDTYSRVQSLHAAGGFRAEKWACGHSDGYYSDRRAELPDLKGNMRGK